MKRNKKGFTLVELVIVIAVIAILAAVLLPTFATVIENAKVSSATQKARNALTDYLTQVATVSTVDTVDTIDDLEGYILYVENGTGAVDYKFEVKKGGELELKGKIDFVRGGAEKPEDDKDTNLAICKDASEGVLAVKRAMKDATNYMDMLNGVYVYTVGTHVPVFPTAA